MLKDKLISIAEVVDAWRVVPRIILLAYGYLVIKLYKWFISLETFEETKCDASLMTFLSNNNPDLTLQQLQDIACTVIGVVGGPTTAQSAFVTTIISLSTAVIGLYVTTGRKWGNDKGNNGQQPSQPYIVNYPSAPIPTAAPQYNAPPTQPPSYPPQRPSHGPDIEVDEVKLED